MTLNIKTAVFGILAMAGSLGAFAEQPADIITTPEQPAEAKKEKKESRKVGLLGDFYYTSDKKVKNHMESETESYSYDMVFNYYTNPYFYLGAGYRFGSNSNSSNPESYEYHGDRVSALSQYIGIPLEVGFKIGPKFLAITPFAGINGNCMVDNTTWYNGKEQDQLPEKFSDRLSTSGRSGIRLYLFNFISIAYNYDFPLNSDVGFSKIGNGNGRFSFGLYWSY